MIKRFIIAIVLLVVVCGGIVGFNLFRAKAIADIFANAQPPAVTVSTVTVEPTVWRPGVEAIGTVSASRGVDLTVEVAGVVKTVNFKSNQAVKAGDVLVQIDDAVEQADLRASQAQGQLNQQTLQRAIELQQRGVGSDVTLDQARASSANSASQIDRYQAVVDQKQLRAPFTGTAGIPQIEAGQYIQPGNVVATLQDLNTMRADFSIPEQQLPLLKIGQTVRFGATTDALDFEGTITGIEPKVDPVSRLVSVRAEVREVAGRLSPGQFVQVRVILPEEPNVVALPQTALVSSLYGDYVYAVRAADASATVAQTAAPPANTSDAAAKADAARTPAAPKLVAKQIFVKAGRRSEGLVEIASGVVSGDQIVTAGQNRLSNNAPVTVDNTVTPGTAPGRSQDKTPGESSGEPAPDTTSSATPSASPSPAASSNPTEASAR